MRYSAPRPSRRLAFAAALLPIFALLLVAPANAQSDAHSLKLVPADVAFYNVLLNNRQQIDAIAKSKAWAKIMSFPVVQEGLKEVEKQFKNPFSPASIAKALMDLPENKKLVELMGDMASHEMFVAGENSWGDSVQFLVELYLFANSLQAEALRDMDGGDPLDKLLEYLDANRAKMRIPETLIGFRHTSAAEAKTQLARLEKFLGDLLAVNPMLRERFKRETINGCDALTLRLDSSMLPLDEIPWDGKDVKYPELFKALKKINLTILLGVRDEFVLVSIGEGDKFLSQFGKAAPLAGRAEMAPLAKFAEQKLAHIAYRSEDFARKSISTVKSIDNTVRQLEFVLSLTPLDEGFVGRISKDMHLLAEDIKRSLAKPAAAMSFSFLTSRGFESYTYDWTEQRRIDGTKNLSLLSHLGGAPLLAMVNRSKGDKAQYDAISGWAQKIFGYVEEAMLTHAPEDEASNYKMIRAKVLPLIARAHKTTSEQLLPALSGQSGIVLDSKIKSKQWIKPMPAAKEELPMLELAFLLEVSDAELVKKAVAEYASIYRDAVAEAKKLIPEFEPTELSKPVKSAIPGGTLMTMQFPGEWGVDKQLSLVAGLTDKLAIVSTSGPQALRVLAAKPPVATQGPLAKLDRPLASATIFNFAGLIDTALPWVDYGMWQGMSSERRFRGRDDDKPSSKGVPADTDVVEIEFKQISRIVHEVAELLKCFKGYNSVSYLEGPALVTHGETLIEDLK